MVSSLRFYISKIKLTWRSDAGRTGSCCFSFDTHQKAQGMKGTRSARFASLQTTHINLPPCRHGRCCLDVEILENDTLNSLPPPRVVDYLSSSHVLHGHIFEVATHFCQERHVLFHFIDFFMSRIGSFVFGAGHGCTPHVHDDVGLVGDTDNATARKWVFFFFLAAQLQVGRVTEPGYGLSLSLSLFSLCLSCSLSDGHGSVCSCHWKFADEQGL